MANSIDPKKLQETVMDYLENYSEDIQDKIVKITDNVTKEAKEKLKQISHKKFKLHGRKNPYYLGWATKTDGKNKQYRYVKAIWNKTNYQLTHLLEFGHATKNGKHTKANPHIRPVEEEYSKIFEEKLEKAIRRESN